jgi:hypothetical protein
MRSGVLMRPRRSLDHGSLPSNLDFTVVNPLLHLGERVARIFSGGLEMGHGHDWTLAGRNSARQRRSSDSSRRAAKKNRDPASKSTYRVWDQAASSRRTPAIVQLFCARSSRSA